MSERGEILEGVEAEGSEYRESLGIGVGVVGEYDDKKRVQTE